LTQVVLAFNLKAVSAIILGEVAETSPKTEKPTAKIIIKVIMQVLIISFFIKTFLAKTRKSVIVILYNNKKERKNQLS
jgi:hypothetical protein